MKMNVKRAMGLGALALAMTMNVGAAAMAANQEEIAAETRKDMIVSIQAEGAALQGESSDADTLQVSIVGSDGTALQFKTDSETGESLVSEDGGKTWKPATQLIRGENGSEIVLSVAEAK